MTARLFWEALNDISIETIETVADELIRTEPNMLAIPPPGRWRQLADEYFELKSQRQTYVPPRERLDCEECSDTGWRLVRNAAARYVVPCECRDGGLPPSEDHGPTFMHERTPLVLDGEIGPQENETELQRRRREHGNHVVVCPCCGSTYRIRSGWHCCAPPTGMSTAVWMARWHASCPTPAPHAVGPGKNRCPNHCLCPPELKPRTKGLLGVPQPAEGEHVHDWAVRMGMRDKDAPRTPEPAMSLESEWPEEESNGEVDESGPTGS